MPACLPAVSTIYVFDFLQLLFGALNVLIRRLVVREMNKQKIIALPIIYNYMLYFRTQLLLESQLEHRLRVFVIVTRHYTWKGFRISDEY